MSRTFRLDVDPDASLVRLMGDLRGLVQIESVSPQYVSVSPFATPATRDAAPGYARALIRADEALLMEPGDSALIVAVVDSGLDAEHTEFLGRTRPGSDLVDLERARLSRGLHLFGDTRARDRSPGDDAGHGTQCAGILAARGLRVPQGLAGAARLLPIRVLAGARMVDRERPTAIGGLADIDAGVKTAVDLGARVLNLSFGTPESSLREDDPIPHADVVAYAARRGCILVAASGNSGIEERYFPAALDRVIAVGAVGPGARPAAFSTTGDHVALSAPGEGIRTTTVGGYTECTGTSFAAPFVTAAAALLVAHGARYSTPVSPARVRRLLCQTAIPFDVSIQGFGAGVLDARAALERLRAEIDAQPGMEAA